MRLFSIILVVAVIAFIIAYVICLGAFFVQGVVEATS
jgi:hypothetical protein